MRATGRTPGLTRTRHGGVAAFLCAAALLAGCGQGDAPDPGADAPSFERIGTVRVAGLDEISGIASLPDGGFVVHNDEGSPRLYVTAADGTLQQRIEIDGARIRDWEDLAVMPGPAGPLLVIADTGDNAGLRKSVRLYFVALPGSEAAGTAADRLRVTHALKLRYPDGPRDVESVAYDPAGDRLLLLSKRDRPPRLYEIDAAAALQAPEATAGFVGEVPGLRPPARADLLRDPFRGPWVSQPTGLDIRADGRMAAIITYRSLYLFRREDGDDWGAAFQRVPLEIPGPPGTHDEAVTFDATGGAVIVTAEGLPAPVYRLDLARVIQPASSP